ncbi:MAG: S8 family serine peptidase [Candidatus Thalassarchaeaceae archaeon]|nr:S8 family serine peptidase [Candidatus Thalassarchaeaceae archaeon]
MSSVNAVRSRLSLALVAVMILPTILSISQFDVGPPELEEMPESKESIEVPSFMPFDTSAVNFEDPSHGWNWDEGNTGKAALYYRTASYVPIHEWEQVTGESFVSGWHALGHDYPIPSDWKNELEEMGMECRTFYAPQGFHCDVPRLSPATLHDAGVIGAFRLADIDKIAPDAFPILQGESQDNADEGSEKYLVRVLLSGSGHITDLLKTGVELSDYRLERFADVLVGSKEIGMLSEQPFVEWVEPIYSPEFDNQEASEIIGANWVGESSNMMSHGGAVTGDGVIVAVMDSGLDTALACSSLGNCNSLNSGIHADFAGRIMGVVSYNGCGSCPDGTGGPNDYNGHGTHVAGSVLGDGSNSPQGEDNSGTAPGAYLFMQAVGYGSNDGSLAIPDFEDAYAEAYAAGARVHTNSWGTGPDACAPTQNNPTYTNSPSCWAYYSSDTMELDAAANNYQDLTILFAMGNDGRDCTYASFGWQTTNCPSGQDGEINLGALNRQATAKNIISVGASENVRNTLTMHSRSYFSVCGNCDWYGTPIKNDLEGDNSEGMAGFSNRGPTSDGRIKPDIVAPGTWIHSTKTSLRDVSTDLGDYYTVKRGTSMATPITAGSVALVIEHLNAHGYDCNLAYNSASDNCPESALVKAILSASAHDMEGQYSSGGDGQNGAVEKAPNSHEGWGRVDLERAMGSGFSEGIEIATSDSHSFKLSVPDSGITSLRVVLSWNEVENSPSAGTQLRNDLDIYLKSPTGVLQAYTNDDVNNLVGISVDSPDAGDWEVIVTGANVIDGSQKYYLAASDGVLTDMRHPVSDEYNEPGFQSGSIFTETTMTIGDDHLCAILDDASLQCWGSNEFGQLGDGTTTDRLTMTEVSLDAARTATSISSGKDHTCSILDNGELQCWGRNNYGQLGDGTNSHSISPVGTSLTGVPVQISSGDWHTCAIMDDASLQCWGRNTDGQIGDGTNTDRSTPVSVTLGEKVLAVSAGGSHTCAITESWALKCWGSNGNGQLGIGSTTSSNSPSTVTVGSNAVAVSAGSSHTCSLLQGNNVKCWGDNSKGQLGDGGTNQQNDAATVGITLASAISIDSGRDHTCAVDSSDSLHCWGGGADGQVGDGSNSEQISSPAAIDLGQNLGALSISSGGSYTCVVGSNDLARCWGGASNPGALSLGNEPSGFAISRWSYISSSERDWNNNGNLNIFEVGIGSDGDGDGFPSSEDSDDSNPTVAADCLSGSYGRFTCRQATPGYYVSGTGNTVMTPASPGHYVDSDGATSEQPCNDGEFQRLSGQTSCDDAEPGYYVPDPGATEGTPCPAGKYNDLPGQNSVTACKWADEGHSVPVLLQMSSGASHSCAILDDGSVSCWGDNTNGQLGDGSRSPSLEPEKSSMPLGRRAVEISAGSYHTCSVFDDGSVRCWGSNEFGQLGDGTTIERTSPVPVELGQGMSALGISSGESHTCVILSDHSVKCWGQNSNGQLGDGTSIDSSSPIPTEMGGKDALSISTGSYHTCAIMSDRTVRCWGDNWNGQIGDGTNTDRATPVEISIPSNSSAVSLDAGAMHTCLGVNDGSMFCWGYNAYGQLGNGGNSNSNSPIAVPLSTNQLLTSVEVGLFHSCALFDSGEIACWGDNSNGQLGDGSQVGSTVPEIVSLNENATSVSVGLRHSCVILEDASLLCWGANEAGQIGDGTSSHRDNPTTVDLGHGSKEQLPCAPGSYQPNTSQTTCILADRGFMVPQSGQTSQMGCVAGYYSSLRGQPTCTAASRGYYVSESQSASQTPCPSGKSTLEEASTFFDMCFSDFDGDGIPDAFDTDADNDGVPNVEDYDWLDPDVAADSDGDRIPDSIDVDDDNDGVNDTDDPFPMDQGEWEDKDGDGIGDNADEDDDGDGRRDIFDVFPNDGDEWSDADGDGIGDNTDADDDNDGRCDDSTYWRPDLIPPSNSGPSQDGDGIPDCFASAKGDAFPFDANETDDTDGDSIGNNVDTDCDGDGWLNPVPCTMNSDGVDGTDAFPLDWLRWSDSDGDGHSDQGPNSDAFPDDPTEWMDSDRDGVGNNADECQFEPGINPSNVDYIELLSLPGNDLGCPIQTLIGDDTIVDELDSASIGFYDGNAPDFDGDDIPDLLDPDDDNDGIPDLEDGVLGNEKWSRDPFRPFTTENWGIIILSISFIGIMGYRMAGWKGRGISSIRSKKIRIK